MVTEFNALFSGIDNLGEFSELVDNNITDEITIPITNIINDADDLVNGFLSFGRNTIDDLEQTASTFEKTINTPINTFEDDVYKQLNGYSQKVVNPTSVIGQADLSLASELESRQDQSIADFHSRVLGFENRILDTVQGDIGDLEERVDEHLATLLESITTTHELTIEEIARAEEEITKKSEGFFTEVKDKIQTGLPDFGMPFGFDLSAALTPLLEPLTSIVNLLSVSAWEEATQEIDKLWVQFENDPDIGPVVKSLSPDGAIPLLPFGLAAIVTVGSVIASAATGAYFAGEVEKTRQSNFKRTRPSLLSIAELQQAGVRDLITDDAQYEEYSRRGFTDTDQSILTLLAQIQLNIPEVLTMWHRGIIDDDEVTYRLKKLGLRREDIPWALMLSYAIPGIQDIILFAVREVFDVETADRFGQLDGLSDKAKENFRITFGQFGGGLEGSTKAFEHYANQAGLSPQWAAAYWAAHWRLPGVQTLFQMVHRLNPEIVAERADDYREIGLDPDELGFELSDLQRTLRAQDYSPFFRDKITALSYKPITRVDVRRMNRLGLVSDKDLVRRYRELGFSPADAGLMAAFTIDYNQAPEETEDLETKNLTRANIIAFLESGHYTTGEALIMLQDIGYTETVSQTFINLSELKTLRRIQDSNIQTVRERYKAGIIDYNTAVTELDNLDLPSYQRDSVLADFEAEAAQRIKTPTLAQLTKFAENGQLTPTELLTNIRALGYDLYWAVKFVSLAFGITQDEIFRIEDITEEV